MPPAATAATDVHSMVWKKKKKKVTAFSLRTGQSLRERGDYVYSPESKNSDSHQGSDVADFIGGLCVYSLQLCKHRSIIRMQAKVNNITSEEKEQ